MACAAAWQTLVRAVDPPVDDEGQGGQDLGLADQRVGLDVGGFGQAADEEAVSVRYARRGDDAQFAHAAFGVGGNGHRDADHLLVALFGRLVLLLPVGLEDFALGERHDLARHALAGDANTRGVLDRHAVDHHFDGRPLPRACGVGQRDIRRLWDGFRFGFGFWLRFRRGLGRRLRLCCGLRLGLGFGARRGGRGQEQTRHQEQTPKRIPESQRVSHSSSYLCGVPAGRRWFRRGQ